MDASQKKSGLALAGVIIGAIALLLSAIPIINNFAFVLAALSLIFGIIGLKQARKSKRALAAVILSVLAIIVVLASQAFYGKAVNDVGKSLDQAAKQADQSMADASGKNTDKLLGKVVDVKLGTFSATEADYVTNTELPVTVTNKASAQKTYSIEIEAVDASGKRIADDTVYANDLKAGQSQDFKAFQYVESDKIDALKTATFNVLTVSQY